MEDPRENLGRWTATALLLAAAAVLCFYRYDIGGPRQEVEARLIETARRMNLAGTWLAPTSAGRVDAFALTPAPPLASWTIKATARLDPDVPTRAARLPMAICSFLIVLLVAAWSRRQAARHGREDGEEPPVEGFALLAGLMIGSMPLFFWVGRQASAGPMFALLYLASAFCWAESLEARRSFYSGWPWRRWLALGYALAGVGMLVGGPLVLLMLWLPYACSARSYRLHRIDASHLVGTLLAVAIGAWWPWAMTRAYPGDPAVAGLWRDWLALRSGQALMTRWGTVEFLRNLVLGTLPWSLLALVMCARVWRRKDRSPTLVFWMWSLAVNLVLLPLVNNRAGSHPLPLAALVALLATDAAYRWNFESAWARAWRVLLRAMLLLALPVAVFACGVIGSGLGLALLAVIAIGWARWALLGHRPRTPSQPWLMTTRLIAIAMAVLLASEVAILSDWLPGTLDHVPTVAYFARVRRRIAGQKARFYLVADAPSALHEYYLQDRCSPIQDPTQAQASELQPTYVFLRRDVVKWRDVAWLTPLTDLESRPGQPPEEIMFRVVPPSQRAPSSAISATASAATAVATAAAEPTDRLMHRLPYRLALLGNTGTRQKEARQVAAQLQAENRRGPIDDVALLGDNIGGDSAWARLNVMDGFETPFRKLLRDGARFHAVLGPQDQDDAWLQTRYPDFNMNGRRYYMESLGDGLVDLFALDAERLAGDVQGAAQIRWLEQALAASKAPWKIVVLGRALLSDAGKAHGDAALAGRLLPLFERHQVDVVAWAGGPWYERLELPNRRAIFLNVGWSGQARRAAFKGSPALQASDDRESGFFYADFTVTSMIYRAVDRHGHVVDMGLVRKESATRAAASSGAVELDVGAPAKGAAAREASTTTTTTATTTAPTLKLMPTPSPSPTSSPSPSPSPTPSPTPKLTPSSAPSKSKPAVASQAGRS
jgi:4-amino-4-deoxy-L-arabinose transferase-like glycosyltransferase